MYTGFTTTEDYITLFLNVNTNEIWRYSVFSRNLIIRIQDLDVNADFICSEDFIVDGIEDKNMHEKLFIRNELKNFNSILKYNCHALTFLNSKSLWFKDKLSIDSILEQLCHEIVPGMQKNGDILVLQKGTDYVHSATFINSEQLFDKSGWLNERDNISLHTILTGFEHDNARYFQYKHRPMSVIL